VLLLAATNRVDVLDPALLRPGRISRRVTVPLPDEAGRAAILGVHLRGVALEGGEGVKADVARQLAAVTPGFSGARVTLPASLPCCCIARGWSTMLDAVKTRLTCVLFCRLCEELQRHVVSARHCAGTLCGAAQHSAVSVGTYAAAAPRLPHMFTCASCTC
jgi:hypothetical protein